MSDQERLAFARLDIRSRDATIARLRADLAQRDEAVARLRSGLGRLASNRAFFVASVATEEERARMFYAEHILKGGDPAMDDIARLIPTLSPEDRGRG